MSLLLIAVATCDMRRSLDRSTQVDQPVIGQSENDARCQRTDAEPHQHARFPFDEDVGKERKYRAHHHAKRQKR